MAGTDTWGTAANWSAGAPADASGVVALVPDTFGAAPILSGAVLDGFTLDLHDNAGVAFPNVSLGGPASFVVEVTNDLPDHDGTSGMTDFVAFGAAGTPALTFETNCTINISGASGTATESLFELSGGAAPSQFATVTNDGTINNDGYLQIGAFSTSTTSYFSFVNNGIVQGGTDALFGPVSGGGTITVGVVQAYGDVAASQTLDFGGAGKAELDLFENDPGMGSGTFSGLLTHMGPGNKVVLENVSSVSITSNMAGVVKLNTSAGSMTLTTDYPGAVPFKIVNESPNTALVIACFAAGTRIATPDGEVAVETLRVGDRVLALRMEEFAPIIWTGHRRVDCRLHPRPREVWPVRVRAGAFGVGMPHRDLWLSPDHAVFIDGVLIPVRYLINDATILRAPLDSITYWHVELARHEVILADGMPCESYLDTGNRAAFENGGTQVHLHADFTRKVSARPGCAPLVLEGAGLEAARSHLRERAATLGRTTKDPALDPLCSCVGW
jgi:hypothetical protein